MSWKHWEEQSKKSFMLKNEFAARARTMDLESASELLQEKAKIRDDEIVQIQAAYDTEIQLLQSKLSTCKEEDRAYYEEQIANLEQDKQEKDYRTA